METLKETIKETAWKAQSYKDLLDMGLSHGVEIQADEDGFDVLSLIVSNGVVGSFIIGDDNILYLSDNDDCIFLEVCNLKQTKPTEDMILNAVIKLYSDLNKFKNCNYTKLDNLIDIMEEAFVLSFDDGQITKEEKKKFIHDYTEKVEEVMEGR